jgi:chemotaxis signal transduction protein
MVSEAIGVACTGDNTCNLDDATDLLAFNPLRGIMIIEEVRRLEGELVETWRRLGGQQQDQHSLHVLEVTVVNRTYLIPVSQISKVVAMAQPQPLANSPDWVLGNLPYGSVTVPLIDLNLRLGGRPSELSQDLFVVVVDQPSRLGLVVSAVGRVLEIEAASLTLPFPVPPIAFLIGSLHGGEDRVASLLSVVGFGRQTDESELPDRSLGV